MSLENSSQPLAATGHFQFDEPCLHELAVPGSALVDPMESNYRVDYRFVRTPSLFVQEVHVEHGYRSRSAAPAGCLSLFLPICQAPETTLWKTHYEPGGLPCSLPGPADLLFAAGQAHFMAFLNLDLLHRMLPEHTVEVLLRCAAGRLLPAGSRAASRLALRFGAMIHEIQRQPGVLQHPEAVWSFQDDVVAETAALVESSAQQPSRLFRDGRTAGLRRALEYLQYHGVVGVGVTELAKVAAVSPRTLERAFQDHYDITARDYLYLRRLQSVRRDLIISRKSEVRICEVAWRHGFFELGRFAQAYSRRFGELPSETLAREPPHRDRLAWH